MNTGNTQASDIDFVLIWVDDTDVEWQRKKNEYAGDLAKFNVNNVRYRDWDTLQYWFRAVEKYAPWVRKIHFVTCGHVPEWLNLEHTKLNFVKHEEYIPKQFLPTFSSHPIELNLHRIKGLSEKFVYFNDDTFLTSMTRPEDFFVKGQPCDCAILNPQMADRFGIGSIVNNNLGIIAYYFDFTKQLKSNWRKWINIKYGKLLIRTALLLPWQRYIGFYEPHLPNAYLKSTFEEVWNKEKLLLEEVSNHKFRTDSDVNQWLMRYWQLASGRFVPRNPKIGKMLSVATDMPQIVKAITEKQYKLLCINDSEQMEDITEAKEQLCQSFQKVFPEKSEFEK